jgi:hypothetical protein
VDYYLVLNDYFEMISDFGVVPMSTDVEEMEVLVRLLG